MSLTAERLREVLRYEPDTGNFYWLIDRGGKAKAGVRAGCLSRAHCYPYWKISVDGKLYFASRLAVLYMTGSWPEHEVDHADMDGTNNRWVNLRVATRPQNSMNKRRYRNNKTGYKGVSIHALTGRYRARVMLNGREIHIGLFDTPLAAFMARLEVIQKLHGEFARSA